MSSYNDHHSEGTNGSRRSHRSRRPVYEEKIIESRQGRNGPPLQQALIRRPNSSSGSSVEEIDREYDPEMGTYVQRRSIQRDRYGDQYGAPRPRSRGRRPAARRNDSYASSESLDSSEPSRSPPRKRSKSRGEKALEAIGLGGTATAIAKRYRSMSRNRARSKSRTRSKSRARSDDGKSDSYYYSRRSSSRGPGGRSRSRARASSQSPTRRQKIEDAAKAALAAAAIEAWRSRKDVPSDAGRRIITAALASAGIDAAVQREDRHGNRNALVSAIGGIATNRLLNGQNRSRSRSRPGGRRASDSGNVGTVASVAALAAIAGKALKDQHDRSRSRANRDRNDNDSDDGRRYSSSSHHRKSLSEHLHGPTDAILNKMGLPENPDYHHPKYAKDKYGRRHYSDDEDDNAPRLRGGGGDEEDSSDGFSTDSYSSDEEEKKIKKTRTKSLITGGLAAVATIHAAHSVYNSMEARESRHRKVLQGKMSPEEARRQRSKAALQDVAAVGIAALGIKGAISEWKEVREQRHGIQDRRLRLDEMREHRRKKIEQGLWCEEVRKKKRDEHLGRSNGGGSQGSSENGRPAIRDSSRRRDGKAIGYYDSYDADRDLGKEQRQANRGRSRGQSARRVDGYDSEDDDYDYYYSQRERGRGRDSQSKRSSLPPAVGRKSVRRSYNTRGEDEYDIPPSARGSSRYADDEPRYVDGNPYATASLNSPLSSQLPPPPLKSFNAAPRY